MDSGLKQRLIGAAVLVALAVIFLPMLVQGPAPDSGVSDLSLDVPPTPTSGYETRDLPLVVPQAATSEGLLADDGSLATVDTANAPSPGDDAAAAVSPLSPDAAESVDPAASTASPLADAATVAAVPLPEAPAATPSAKPEPEADKPVPAKPAPPAAAAVRLPAATAGGDYAVGFGAYATRANAGTVVDRLRKDNLPAYVEETTVGGRDAWRVRIGPYASRADAESARIAAGRIGSSATASVVALDAASPPAATAAAPAKPAPATPAPVTPAASTAPRPAPATSTSTPAAAAGTGFAVQLGAFSSAADANALRDRARSAGIAAFTETVQTDKGPLTRVKAGPVVGRAEADQLKAQARARLGVDGLVRSHP